MMDARQRYAAAGEIFAQVVDLRGEEREVVIARACGDDDDLREQVLDLLAHDRELTTPPLVDSIGARLADEFETVASQAGDDTAVEILRADGYRFIRRIGVGGMGAVWLAEQESPPREVACKVILPWRDDATEQSRFEREIEALARLRDPGITQIFAAGTVETTVGPRPFFTMELIEGPGIVDHAVERGLSIRERLELFVSVCDAVQHAHDRGVIHRDLKPANILVDLTGAPRAKVLDFGVARILDSASETATLSGDNRLFGTLPFMAPEQAAGSSREIGPRTDVYALGACLYNLIAGRLPIDLTGLGLTEAVRKIHDVEPFPLDSPFERVPGDLDVIVTTALAKEPASRYPSAAALAEDLRNLLADRPISARPPGAVARLARFGRKNRATVVGVAATLIVAVVGAIVATTFAFRAHEAEQLALRDREEARRLGYAAELGAGLALVDEDPHQARRHLESAEAEFRGWEWHHLAGRLDAVVHIEPHEGAAPDAAHVELVWPQGPGPLAAVVEGTELRIRDLSGRSTATRLELGGRVWRMAFTPDGRRLAAVLLHDDHVEVVVVDAVTTEVVWRSSTSAAGPSSLSFAADGERVLVGTVGGKIVELRPHAPSRDLATGLGRIHSLTSFSGAAWVCHRLKKRLQLTRLHSEHSVPTTDFSIMKASGRGLLCVDPFRVMQLRDVETLEVTVEYRGHLRSATSVAITDDAERMASSSPDGTVRVWDVATGRCLATFSCDAAAIAIAPDGGRVVASTSRGIEILDVARDGRNLELVHEDFIQAAAFCLEDRVVVTGGADAVLHFWDAATGELLARRSLENSRMAIRSIAPWSDGTRLTVIADWKPVVVHLGSLVREPADHRTDHWLAKARRGSSLRTLGNNELLGGVVGTSTSGRELVRDGLDGPIAVFKRPITAVDLDPTSTRFAVGAANRIRILDAADGEVIDGPVSHADEVFSLAFSPDGRRLASASNDGTWRIWSVAPLREIARFQEHDSYVYSAAWSEDGTRVVTAGGDGRAIVWDSRSMAERVARRRVDAALRAEMRPRVEARVAAEPDLEVVARELRADASLDAARRAAAIICLLEVAGRR